MINGLPFYKDGEPLHCSAAGARASAGAVAATNAVKADGAPVAFPRWGMTLRAAGSMRFRWHEQNPRRDAQLAALCGTRTPVPLELIHSKTVYDIRAASDTRNKTGDGMITADRALVPVVTVADCMPLFLYDVRTGVFGAFHSGWKGTGIVAEGIALAEARYGVRRDELCVAIGAHIQRCCYVVDEERAEHFVRNFGISCVQALGEYNEKGSRLYALSLLEANLAVLRKAGIRDGNIVAATDCTCCTRVPFGAGERRALRGTHTGAQAGAASDAASAYYPFGSFRREAAFMPPSVAADARSRLMTVQAAFCGWV